jgi:hypothetical protein
MPGLFDMPPSRIVNSAGKRTVHIRTTIPKKQCCTMMLAITANRQKLPLYVVFKCKMMAKGKLHQGITVPVQESGWMTQDQDDDWFESVWVQQPNALLCQQPMLVLDSFWGQTTENVKAQLQQQKCKLVIISQSMTGMLQPLDVIINWLFKAHTPCSYNEWAQKTYKATMMGSLKRTKLREMCWWSLKALQATSQDMIVKSFKVNVISNKMDRNEDNFMQQ